MSINWDYYSEIAHKSSATEVRNEDGSIECKQNSFSIDFFYANQQESRLNPITKAFLEPHNNSLPQYEPVTGIEEIKDFFSGFNKKPNEAQYEAILHAINDSVSIIQGPPGTGKTDTIVNILRMLFHLYPATNDENTRTAAIVSNNSEAVENIHAALNESNEPFDIGLKTHFTKLGNSNVRKEWVNQNPDKAHLFNSISKRFNPELLRFFPFFTSTIHSLRRNFSQGFDNQFDYVIIDECSQSSIHLGLMAMSCAKHLVLLGDNKQLS
ncbi:MAG: AAA domain-containing protein, partial [Ruminiclostridium sp.]